MAIGRGMWSHMGSVLFARLRLERRGRRRVFYWWRYSRAEAMTSPIRVNASVGVMVIGS